MKYFLTNDELFGFLNKRIPITKKLNKILLVYVLIFAPLIYYYYQNPASEALRLSIMVFLVMVILVHIFIFWLLGPNLFIGDNIIKIQGKVTLMVDAMKELETCNMKQYRFDTKNLHDPDTNLPSINAFGFNKIYIKKKHGKLIFFFLRARRPSSIHVDVIAIEVDHSKIVLKSHRKGFGVYYTDVPGTRDGEMRIFSVGEIEKRTKRSQLEHRYHIKKVSAYIALKFWVQEMEK